MSARKDRNNNARPTIPHVDKKREQKKQGVPMEKTID